MVIYTTPYTKNLSFQLPSERIVLKLTDIKPISLLFILAHNHQFVQMIRWCKWVWAFQPFAAEARQLAAVTQFHHVPSQWQACPVELMFTVFWLIFTMLLCKAFCYFLFFISASQFPFSLCSSSSPGISRLYLVYLYACLMCCCEAWFHNLTAEPGSRTMVSILAKPRSRAKAPCHKDTDADACS